MTDPQNPTPSNETPAYQPAPPAPEQPAPGYQAAPQGSQPGRTLGIVGLIFAFFMPIVGLILAYIGRSQSRKAGIANTPAKAGIIVGWIVFALQLILLIVVVSLFIAGLNMISEVCGDLGPGEHLLNDGITTVTCP
ncbi:DUF4190 domain-containing protein [Microbacterium sp.]|uniref:DUF4190 domain-containing protein n=1 Tax=Microbacterium sp. TaxID=51671 RepID=UPI003A8C4664